MSAPEDPSGLPPWLASYTVSRSGPSITVRCWQRTCAQPIVFRSRDTTVSNLFSLVERHWRAHHETANDRALREAGAVGEQLDMLRKVAAKHGIAL